MKVLVADGVASQRDATVKLLSAAGHKVDTANTVAETEAALAKNRYDVFITEADFPERPAEGQSVVKRFRAAEKDGHLYILMLSAQMTPMRIVQAFDVGCDDVARKPISAEELLARAGASDRIRKWAGFLFKEEGNVDFAQKANLANMRAWKEAPHATATILAGMFNLNSKPIPLPPKGPMTGAELSLVLSDDAGEVTLAVGCDAASLKELAELSLGTPQPSMTALGDMMKEIANTVGGALKRLSDADRIPMTIGLPKVCETLELKSEQAGSISSYAI